MEKRKWDKQTKIKRYAHRYGVHGHREFAQQQESRMKKWDKK